MPMIKVFKIRRSAEYYKDVGVSRDEESGRFGCDKKRIALVKEFEGEDRRKEAELFVEDWNKNLERMLETFGTLKGMEDYRFQKDTLKNKGLDSDTIERILANQYGVWLDERDMYVPPLCMNCKNRRAGYAPGQEKCFWCEYGQSSDR